MPYSSAPRSLEFWLRLQSRLAAESKALRHRLVELMAPLMVTVDTGEAALQRAPQLREGIFELEATLDKVQLLSAMLRNQLRVAMLQAGVPNYEDRLSYLRELAALHAEYFCGRPHRFQIENDIRAAINQYAGLRTAGTGELVTTDRQRLRAMSLQLPVLGAEDTVEHEQGLRSLYAEIDQLDTELQALKVTTLMSLQTGDDMADLVTSFGVEMLETAEAAEPEATAATEPANSEPNPERQAVPESAKAD